MFDPRQFVLGKYGFPKTGSFRAKFMLESVENLKKSLQKIGIQGFQSYKSSQRRIHYRFPTIRNLQGKSIKTWNEMTGQDTTLSLEGLESGLYVYTAQNRNGQKYMGKLVVGK